MTKNVIIQQIATVKAPSNNNLFGFGDFITLISNFNNLDFKENLLSPPKHQNTKIHQR